MELSEKMKQMREEAGLTRKEFSMRIGMPVKTIEDWEEGRKNPPEYMLGFLAKFAKGNDR